ncbi:MAG TPA: LamG-like jellyroll fold domain-containing protein [Phycisphaerae bacterium]|jgi:hypothetical protein
MRTARLGLISGIVLASLSLPAAHAALVAHWAFDESPGATVAQDSVGGINGTLVNNAAFVAGGISGDAVQFSSATNDYITMGNHFGFTSGSFTVVAWIKTTSTNFEVEVSKHHSNSPDGYYLATNHDPAFNYGALNKSWFYDSTSASGVAISTKTINDGAWHQVVGVYTAGSTISHYVDGVFQSSNTATTIVANDAPFMIGGYLLNATSSPTGQYNGLVDDVQLYDTALTQSQISQLFQTPGSVVPEPASLALFALPVLAILTRRRSLRLASPQA